jgi:hypothetical protein
MTEDKNLQKLIDVIQQGHQAFRKYLAIRNLEETMIDTLPAHALALNYVCDFTNSLMTVLQLMNIDFKPYLMSFQLTPLSTFMVLDCPRIISLINKDLTESEQWLKNAKRYTDMSSGKKYDQYFDELEIASLLVNKNYNQIRFKQ